MKTYTSFLCTRKKPLLEIRPSDPFFSLSLFYYVLLSISYPVSLKQGDQIGRIFAYWVIVYYEHIYENYRNSQIFGLLFHGKSNGLHFDKKMMSANILGDFFTNSSGNPALSPESKLYWSIEASNV
jgi:hypothetical protein